jgi:hypothetical protein
MATKSWKPREGLRVRSKIRIEVKGGNVGSGRRGKPIIYEYKGIVEPGDLGFIMFFDEDFRSGWFVQFDNGLSAVLSKRELEPINENDAPLPPLQPWEI